MKSLLLLGCLLLTSPAFSQTPRYTNADLGQSVSSVKVTPAEAAAILAPNQFQLPGPSFVGPRVLGIHSSPTAGPFGEFREFSPARRLDGTLLSDPQWSVSTWIPFGGFGGGYGGGRHVARASHGHSGPRASSASSEPARRSR
jgi:hypothetical protein